MMRSYMNDQIEIHTATLDKFNAKTWTTRTVRARVEKKKRWTKDQDGKQTMTTAVVILEAQELALGDRIKFGELVWNIITITEARDFSKRFLEVEVA